MKLVGPLFAAAIAAVTLPALAAGHGATPAGQASVPAPSAQPSAVPPAPQPALQIVQAPPRLIVAISVDQFSADLFAEYRNHFTGGFARLLKGAVFPSGYQSHAATETCPGHSTILTGMRPEHTGIIANNWVDLKTARDDKTVYCAEDESVPGSSSSSYTVSDKHLLVPTLGERMKAANPASRVFSVAGKDRAAVMMGGHAVDQLWWWDGKKFTSYAGRAEPPIIIRANEAVTAMIGTAQPPLDLPDDCKAHDRAIDIGGGKSVGTGRFARAAGDARGFRASPEIDGTVFAIAAGLIQSEKLGTGPAPDLIAIGASATDYVGHTYGTEGSEMCIQLHELDQSMGDFFDTLDKLGLDYEVVLTADHGGHDLPERNRDHAIVEAQRIDPGFTTRAINDAVAAKLHLTGQLIHGDVGSGDIWIDPALAPKQHDAVLKEALALYRGNPQVAAAFSRAELEATADPSGPPETWTLVQRARASFYPPRSGDIVVALKPRITPIADPTRGYVATHGSFWDYDRRVPILFWRRNMTGFEQPLSVETVDIMPTLAATIGLPLSEPKPDGRCLDLDAGTGTTCH
ncbi:MAG: alkaline phosphatase family protein [Sphingomonas sp.]|jgi:predicted AlkP superfamily pyrophosphatase or phosphodiesterase